jgi:hypothetical protein
LLVLSKERNNSNSLKLKTPPLVIAKFSYQEFVLVFVLFIIYRIGLKYETLAYSPISLPFRLNGIVEVGILLLIPFYISLRVLQKQRNFWIALFVITIYSLFNIVTFGSKQTAVFPMVVFSSILIATRPKDVHKIFIVIFALSSLYIVFNPYYFRESIVKGHDQTIMEKIENSFNSEIKQNAFQLALLGTRNLAIRITGIIPMQHGIENSKKIFYSTDSLLTANVNNYYNEMIMYSNYGTSDAVGHFGFFIFFFQNHSIGIFFGIVLLFLLYHISFHFDSLSQKENFLRPTLQGIGFTLLILDFLVDGNYDKLSGYLKLAFGFVSIGILARMLLEENLPLKIYNFDASK